MYGIWRPREHTTLEQNPPSGTAIVVQQTQDNTAKMGSLSNICRTVKWFVYKGLVSRWQSIESTHDAATTEPNCSTN